MVHGVLDDNIIFKDKTDIGVPANTISFMAYIRSLSEFPNLYFELVFLPKFYLINVY